MGAVVDVGRWQECGGTVLQSTAPESGRVTRTFVAPSGEKFRTWKECLKYMAAEVKTSSPHINGNGNCSKKTVPEFNGSGKPEEAENGHVKSDGSAKKKRARKAEAAVDNDDENDNGNCTNGPLAMDVPVNEKEKGSEVKNGDGKGKKFKREDLDSNSEPTAPEKQNKGSKKSTEKGPKKGAEKSTNKGSKRSLSSTSEEEKVDSDESEQVDLLKQRRPKRAAAAAAAGSFKEKQIDLADEKDNLITVKRDRVVDGEEVAIVMTAESGETQPPRRRILDFIVHDEEGKSQPIEALDIVPLYLSTLVLPLQGNLEKERGFRCEGFGPLISWSISGYDDFKPTIWLCTETAEYTCVKPASVYKKYYDMLFEKAVLCVEIYRVLSKPDGGNPELGLDEMVARVSRSLLNSKHLGSSNIISKDYILSQGAFVANQLAALDEDATGAEQLFSGLPGLVALENESKSREGRIRASNHSLHSNGNGGGIKIRDSSSDLSKGEEEDVLDDDARLARLLQEQEDRKAFNRQQSRRPQPAKGKFYIKINEDEIVGDYPLPAFYKTEEEEMDEYVLFEDDSAFLAPEELPRRMLHDWALYNSDSRLVPLELLPMLAGAETDTEIFGSGLMTEDDGSGYSLDDEEGLSSKSGEDAGSNRPEGIRIYLSAIKEWMIEFGASMLFVSIRTDGAWYRLGKPSPQYEKWYKPVLKTARLAIQIITLLKAESRVSKLSFTDIVKRLAETLVSDVSFISSKVAEVERYVVVHGQIILQQFAEYPDETIRRSAFVMGLGKKMEEKRHVKLALSKKKVVIRKGRNLNPRAGISPDGTRPKPMRATTTKLVNRIWSEYYASNKADGEGGEEQAVTKGNGEEPELEEEAVEEASDDEEETILAVGSKGRFQKLSSSQSKASLKKMKWSGKSIGVTKAKEPVYMKAIVNSGEVSIGDVLSVDLEGQNDSSPGMLLVEYLFEKKNGSAFAHGRVLLCGTQTVLGNAADAREVFLTNDCEDVELSSSKGSVTVQMRNRPWGHEHRMENIALDEAERLRAKSREEEGLPVEYFCRFLYCPERGAFLRLPCIGEDICVKNSVCKACEARDEVKENKLTCLLPDNEGFRHGGVEYRVKDFLYIAPTVFLPHGKDEPAEKFKAGRNKGLRAFAICQLLEVKSADGLKKAVKPKAINLFVRRFFRPEDVSLDKAYKSDMREVFYSEETATVNVENVVGKCDVQKQSHVDNLVSDSFEDVFFCNCIFDPKKGTVKQLPANIRLGAIRPSEKGKAVVDEVATAKRKGKHIEGEEPALDSDNSSNKTRRLATLDIFAGCGGLSEGLQQSGSTTTKWAIEYDHVAAEAFKLNHPGVHVFNENCNVILRSMMEKFGALDDCITTPEAEGLCLKLSEEVKSQLPAPGEVDFINGGPPCQGFSGMNRFSQRAWSKVQCEMILSFLSFADFYRPRFFLLENVRNFVSFNKGQTFRLTVASLLEMGYQVRFGVLQAGNYGVSQSRKRAFIWAAALGEELPEWPEPRYVFASSQLKITLPGGLQYAAVRDAAEGAPLRSVTVRDAIGDLPPVANGADKLDATYGDSPQSWFQKYIRGSATVLYDHICKEMNELNYIRCQRIPRRPGSDWRDLPEEKVKLSTGQLVDLIPWCLPNTADRHNQWKGLFGRLDWDGNFPTSVTDPQPMGKVGMCFHPEQDRIVTVRECARSQGFPDSYRFYGNIHCKHRQIGNAVPPPLAKALGMKLKEVLNAQAHA